MRTGATFRLTGDRGGTAAVVTRLLDLEPSLTFEAGDRMSPRSDTVRQVSFWSLTSALPTDRELADHLDWLLRRLEPRKDALWRLVGDGYTADWFCLAASHATEHAVALDRALLSRLVTLPGDLLLDVMGDDD